MRNLTSAVVEVGFTADESYFQMRLTLDRQSLLEQLRENPESYIHVKYRLHIVFM